MNSRSPFRYVNESVGAFVIISLVLVLAGFLLATRAHHWFTPVVRVTLVLPIDGSFGIRDGADVEVMGTSAGSISDIRVDDDGRMQATMNIRQDFARFVRVDSLPTIHKRFAVGGDAFVEISRGHGAELPQQGATLQAVADRAPTELLQEMITQVRDQAVPAVKEMRVAVEQYTALARDLRDPEKPLQHLVGKLDHIVTTIDSGQSVAGRLLSDPKWAQQVDATLANLTATLDKLKTTAATVNDQSAQLPELITQTKQVLADAGVVIKDMKRASGAVPELVEEMRKEARSVPELVLQAQSMMREIQRLVQGVENHWLIREYVPQDRGTVRIPAGDVGDFGGRP